MSSFFSTQFFKSFIQPLSAIFIIALVAFSLFACNRNTPPSGPSSGAPPAMPVSVAVAHQEMIPQTFEAVGQTEGSREVNVQARVSGLLKQIMFKEGDFVSAGTLLFKIEKNTYENALAQARADLAQQQAQFEQAQRDFQRYQSLINDKAVSQRDYDNALSQKNRALAALEAARANVKNAELNLSYTSVTAPISGITGPSIKSEGNLLTPGVDSALTTIIQTHPLWARFSLSSHEIDRLRQYKNAEVSLISSSGEPLLKGGRLNFTGSHIDPKIGTVQMRAEFANPRLSVMPGQFVRIHVKAGEIAGFKIPQSAIIQTEKGHMVWVIRDGKAIQTLVETGPWIGNEWAIYKGLVEGDQVILDNLIKLSPNAPVSPRASSMGSNDKTPAPSH